MLGKSDFKSLLKWRTRMLKYKEELLKAERPEEAEAEDKPVEPKEPQCVLTETEKDALVREELSQLRANVQAKKKREKKKVRDDAMRCCICVCCMLRIACERIPVVFVTTLD